MEKREIREILYRLEGKRKRLIQPYLISLGLTIGQGQPRILTGLLEEDGITQRQLAGRCEMDAATLSRALDYMEKEKWLIREINPSSRRSYLIRLSPEGRAKAQAVKEGFQRMDKRIWQDISEDEMEKLLHTLKKIEKNLSEEVR